MTDLDRATRFVGPRNVPFLLPISNVSRAAIVLVLEGAQRNGVKNCLDRSGPTAISGPAVQSASRSAGIRSSNKSAKFFPLRQLDTLCDVLRKPSIGTRTPGYAAPFGRHSTAGNSVMAW